MKKVIVTRDNYEEVMFNLIEDQYSADTRNNILDQIQADTFLNFEWQQWAKTGYSESIESYKQDEAAFIEGLTKEEKKRGVLYYLFPVSAAAALVLLAAFYVSNRETPSDTVTLSPKNTRQHIAAGRQADPVSIQADSLSRMPVNKNNIPALAGKEPEDTALRFAFSEPEQHTIQASEDKTEPAFTAAQHDTIKALIAVAKKQSRYKITITESAIEDEPLYAYEYVTEKRYSMADVLNRKDGISLSKFLQNPSSRIITDKNTHKVTIEYTAADNSILVLTLSN